jgi:hypothetical protein
LIGQGIGYTRIKDRFKNAAGITLNYRGATAGDSGAVGTAPTVHYKGLSAEQKKQFPGHTVIMAEYQGGAVSGKGLDGNVGGFKATGNWAQPPDYPGIVFLNSPNINKIYGSEGENKDDLYLKWLKTNVINHELSHSLLRDSHCGDFGETVWGQGKWDTPTPSCVIYHDDGLFGGELNNALYLKNRDGTTVAINSPWHSFREINVMRWQLVLPEFKR